MQELIDRGFYTKEEACDAPNKNIVTRALGADANVDVDVCEEVVVPGTKLLLCSDGLTDMLEDDKILEIVNKYNDDNQSCCQALVNEANQNGGIDNISVIIVEIKASFLSGKKGLSKVLNWFFKGLAEGIVHMSAKLIISLDGQQEDVCVISLRI